jgi:hypothetical protein
MNRFDLRNDLAVQAAKALDAKIVEAVRAAFDDGMDFVRDQNAKFLAEPVDPWVGGLGSYVHTTTYRGGPIAPDRETPADMVRYVRPKDWRRGQEIR